MTLLSVSQSPRLLQAVTGPSRAAREAARGNRFCSLLKNLVSPGQTKEGKATDTGEKGENVEKRENTEKRENMEKRTRSVYSKKKYYHLLQHACVTVLKLIHVLLFIPWTKKTCIFLGFCTMLPIIYQPRTLHLNTRSQSRAFLRDTSFCDSSAATSALCQKRPHSVSSTVTHCYGCFQ